jgi:Domain of unknown function (DUF4397)
MKRHLRLVAMLALALGACKNDSLDLAPDLGQLRVVHAIPTLGPWTLTFDDTTLGDFDFTQIRGINRPGDGNHDVTIDIKLPGLDSPTSQLVTMNLATAIDRVTTLVVNGTRDNPNVIRWQQTARDWATEIADSTTPITVLEVSYANASALRGALDFYLGEDGFNPADQTPVASVDYTELSATDEIESDTLQLAVTPRGDPSTVLYRSLPLNLPPATTVLFVAYDADVLGSDGMPALAIRSLGAGFSAPITNQLLAQSYRIAHGARGVGALDARVADTDELVIGDIEFTEVTPYGPAPAVLTAFNLTAPGDETDVLSTYLIGEAPGLISTVLVNGQGDDLLATSTLDDPRRIVTEAKFRVYQASDSNPTVDVYLVDPGASIEDVVPIVGILSRNFASAYIAMAAGDYDLVITTAGTRDIVGGPTRVSLANNGLYSVMLTDSADANHVELHFIDDPVD